MTQNQILSFELKLLCKDIYLHAINMESNFRYSKSNVILSIIIIYNYKFNLVILVQFMNFSNLEQNYSYTSVHCTKIFLNKHNPNSILGNFLLKIFVNLKFELKVHNDCLVKLKHYIHLTLIY